MSLAKDLNKVSVEYKEHERALHSAGAISLKWPSDDRAYVLISTVPPPQSMIETPSFA